MKEDTTKVYLVRRINLRSGKAEYWSRDTARNFFWPKIDALWNCVYTDFASAKAIEQRVRGSYNVVLYTYSVATAYFTESQLEENKFPPLEGIPDKQSNY